MSRYTGPKTKIVRAVGCDLPGLTAHSYERRPYPPGQHGHERKKTSEYAVRVLETKKLRMNYGVTEGQLRRVIELAHKRAVATDAVMELLERRLDNVVFRAGFARTIPAARQLVRHGHVLVNGKRCDIPSYRVNAGDRIEYKVTKVPPGQPRFPSPTWLSVDRDALAASVNALPDESSHLLKLNMKLVIEHYSRRV
jgi:small subunit ribosomal protein S4